MEDELNKMIIYQEWLEFHSTRNITAPPAPQKRTPTVPLAPKDSRRTSTPSR